jgi:PAS domain-containing protein
MNLPMRKEINCINFIGLFSFIEKYYGAWGINTVMEGLITKRVILKQASRKEVSFQLHYYPGYRVTKDVCDWNLGLYTGLLHASEVEGISSEEVKCISAGDPYCEIRLKWKASGLFNRMNRCVRGWNIKGEVLRIIDDYESSLKERDRLIDKLANSEAKYKSLFESTATANAILENDLNLSLVNTEFEKITGYSKQDMEKTYTLEDIANPDGHQRKETGG